MHRFPDRIFACLLALPIFVIGTHADIAHSMRGLAAQTNGSQNHFPQEFDFEKKAKPRKSNDVERASFEHTAISESDSELGNTSNRESNSISEMEQLLRKRIEENPDDGSSWRLLSRWQFQKGNLPGSLESGQKAVQLDPESASAHFDFAKALAASKQWETASEHFEKVIALAPESDYGRDARVELANLQMHLPQPRQVGPQYEWSANRFGGIGHATDWESDRDRPIAFKLDSGFLFNSNVQLAPISRDVSANESQSYQAFLAPQFEWRSMKWLDLDWGVTFNGYFTLNEGNQSAFNLQDYRPGLFVQRIFREDERTRALRVQYDYALNQFDGDTFANRHSLTTSWIVMRLDSESNVYWTIDDSDFQQDGIDPSTTSADGITNTIGGSHAFYVSSHWLQLLRLGVDVQSANLRGTDFSYDGVFVYLNTETPLPWFMQLNTQLGWGHRNYSKFTGSPSRNENLVHASVSVFRDLNEHWRVTSYATYDRFAADNAQFDSERYLIGIMTTYTR